MNELEAYAALSLYDTATSYEEEIEALSHINLYEYYVFVKDSIVFTSPAS